MRELPSLGSIIVAAVICIALSFGLFQIFGRHVLNYRIRGERIKFLIFGIVPIGSIGVANVAEIRRVTFSELFNPLKINRLILHNRFIGVWVLVRKERGFPREVILTPDDADRFVEEVNRKKAQAKVARD